MATTAAAETAETFRCFGTTCTVIVEGHGPAGSPREAVERARRRLLGWHDQFSRFLPDSELSRLNGDPRDSVPSSPMMLRFVRAALRAAELTGGLVDPTLVGALQRAGYLTDLEDPSDPLAAALATVAVRAPGAPAADPAWPRVAVDARRRTITRPPGVALDSGGVAKGLFADVLAELLGGHRRYVVDCGGDLRLGGTEGVPRSVEVADPFGGGVVHRWTLAHGAAATSSIGRRRWRDADGAAAHHLLDPATGRPAFTGLVQVSALAPSAAEAEALAKAALLAGPGELERRLPHGGVAVHDDGTVTIL